MAIDRAAWRREKLTERVTRGAAPTSRTAIPFMEQDALNATLQGGFAPLSPRYNFMGDFFLLDLERPIEPIVLHFVNAPKPWQLGDWKGEARFAEAIATGSGPRRGRTGRRGRTRPAGGARGRR